MKKDEDIFENINYIKNFLKQMSRSFEDAKTCRKCNESCGDIFYNSYKRTDQAINNVEESIEKLFEKIKELEDLEDAPVPIKIPKEFILQPLENEEDDLEEKEKEENDILELKKSENRRHNDNKRNNLYRNNRQRPFM